MKKTHKLYRATDNDWGYLTWRGAINKRIMLAQKAKEYYRAKAFLNKDNPCRFRVMYIRYEDSTEAIEFNRKILEGQ